MYWHGLWEESAVQKSVLSWINLRAIGNCWFYPTKQLLPSRSWIAFCLPSLNSGYYLSVCRVALMTSCAFNKVRSCDSFHMILEDIKCVWSGIKKRMIQRAHELPCICSSWCTSHDTLCTFCRDDLCNNLYAINLTVRFMKILGTWLTANGHL